MVVLDQQSFVDRFTLLSDASERRTIFLVGAGFSFPLVPLTSEIIDNHLLAWAGQRHGMSAFSMLKRLYIETADQWTRFGISRFDDIMATADSASALPRLSRLTSESGSTSSLPASMFDLLLRGLCPSAEERREFFLSLTDQDRGSINPAHLYLASIVRAEQQQRASAGGLCPTVLTTNFDPLLQHALQHLGQLYLVTDRPLAPVLSHSLNANAVHLVYAHGTVLRHVLLGTEEEIAAERQQSAQLLPLLRGSNVVVVGYSGWQDVCMAALEQSIDSDTSVYWCSIRPDIPMHVSKLLELYKGRGGFVHIPDGAGMLLRDIHRARGLGDVPEILRDPIEHTRRKVHALMLPQLGLSLAKDAVMWRLQEELGWISGALDAATAFLDSAGIEHPWVASRLLERVRLLLTQGKLDAAAALLDRFLESLPLLRRKNEVLLMALALSLRKRDWRTPESLVREIIHWSDTSGDSMWIMSRVAALCLSSEATSLAKMAATCGLRAVLRAKSGLRTAKPIDVSRYASEMVSTALNTGELSMDEAVLRQIGQQAGAIDKWWEYHSLLVRSRSGLGPSRWNDKKAVALSIKLPNDEMCQQVLRDWLRSLIDAKQARRVGPSVAHIRRRRSNLTPRCAQLLHLALGIARAASGRAHLAMASYRRAIQIELETDYRQKARANLLLLLRNNSKELPQECLELADRIARSPQAPMDALEHASLVVYATGRGGTSTPSTYLEQVEALLLQHALSPGWRSVLNIEAAWLRWAIRDDRSAAGLLAIRYRNQLNCPDPGLTSIALATLDFIDARNIYGLARQRLGEGPGGLDRASCEFVKAAEAFKRAIQSGKLHRLHASAVCLAVASEIFARSPSAALRQSVGFFVGWDLIGEHARVLVILADFLRHESREVLREAASIIRRSRLSEVVGDAGGLAALLEFGAGKDEACVEMIAKSEAAVKVLASAIGEHPAGDAAREVRLRGLQSSLSTRP